MWASCALAERKPVTRCGLSLHSNPVFLSSLARRQRSEEWMDQPGIEPEFIQTSLRFIRTVNAALGYTRATLRHLKRFSTRWNRSQTITILDVATGSADIPLAISAWAQRAGFDLRIVGIDLHELTSGVAHDRTRDNPNIRILRGNAMELPFEDASFDYVLTNMFIHHLDEDPVVRVFQEMNRVAKRGVIIADLLRDRRAYIWATLFTTFASKRLRHDARVSVAQAFN